MYAYFAYSLFSFGNCVLQTLPKSSNRGMIPLHDETYFCNRRRGQFPWQRFDKRIDRDVVGTARPPSADAETGSVYQCRSRDHEPLPARRSLRAGRR